MDDGKIAFCDVCFSLLQVAELQATKRLIGVKWFNAAAAARVPSAIEAEHVNCGGFANAHVHAHAHLVPHGRAVLLGSRAELTTVMGQLGASNEKNCDVAALCIAKGIPAKVQSVWPVCHVLGILENIPDRRSGPRCGKRSSGRRRTCDVH